jgi:hypothetical protein
MKQQKKVSRGQMSYSAEAAERANRQGAMMQADELGKIWMVADSRQQR